MKLEGMAGSEALLEFLSLTLRGELLGVFSSGVYFTLGGKTLMLHDSSYGNLPFGIGVKGFKDRGRELGLEQGGRVLAENGRLDFFGSGLSVGLCGAASACAGYYLDNLNAFLEKAGAELRGGGRSALSVYAGPFPDWLEKDTIEDVFARTAYDSLRVLSLDLERGAVSDAAPGLLGLIGLGRGLTPSLDDFICGLLFVLGYAEKSRELNLPALETLRSGVKKFAADRTNVYSAAYLLSAAEGGDFSLMRRCLESKREEELEKALAALLNVGGSSGADMLCGMCYGADYILKQRRFTL